jgi:hypothetical protein
MQPQNIPTHCFPNSCSYIHVVCVLHLGVLFHANRSLPHHMVFIHFHDLDRKCSFPKFTLSPVNGPQINCLPSGNIFMLNLITNKIYTKEMRYWHKSYLIEKHGGTGSTTGQSIRHLWCRVFAQEKFLSSSNFPMSVIIPPLLHTHIHSYTMDADVFDTMLILSAEKPRNHASIDGRSKKYLPFQNNHTGPQAHLVFYLMSNWGSFHGGKPTKAWNWVFAST